MADDLVPASPITLKAKKRKGTLLQRRAKRRCRKTNNAPETIQQDHDSTNPTSDSRIDNQSLIDPDVDCFTNADISAFYWPEPIDEGPCDLRDVDMFFDARILEQANHLPIERYNKIPPELLTGQFSTLDIISQQIREKSPPKQNYETQFPTQSEFIHVCQVADALSDLHQNIPKFSQWGSPFQNSFASIPVQKSETEDTPKRSHDDNETSQTSCIEPNKRGAHNSPKPGPSSHVREKYGREIEKAARKRINFFDDSESKSSLSSELSLQSNEGIQFTPLDEVNLNESIHVHENLLNLSSFFSQSFVEDDVDLTTNGVFRYIMLLKGRRKDARMIHWFRSGQNFMLNDSRSSKSWQGFPSSEKVASTAMESERMNVHELLGEDDEFFKEFSVEVPKNRIIVDEMDIESVLRSADRVLNGIDNDNIGAKDDDAHINCNQGCRQADIFMNPPTSSGNGVNIDSLLHGNILGTPKMAKLSESNSIPEYSPWIMRPRLQNSITASDIEWESEQKCRKVTAFDGSPSAFNSTFIIPSTPEQIYRKEKWRSPTNLKRNEHNPSAAHSNITKEFNIDPKPEDKFLPAFQSVSEHALKIAENLTENQMELKTEDTAEVSEITPVKCSTPVNRHYIKVASKNENECKTQSKQDDIVSIGSLITDFTSAAGRNLHISSAAQQRAELIAVECEEDVDSFAIKRPDPKMRNVSLNETDRNVNLRADKRKPFKANSGFVDSVELKITDNIENNSSVANFNRPMRSAACLLNNDDPVRHTKRQENLFLGLQSNSVASSMCGFQSASGKAIIVSEKSKEKALKMMLDEMTDMNDLIVLPDEMHNNVEIVRKNDGFMYENVLNVRKSHISNTKVNNASMNGFKTAAGSSIKISDEARLRAEQMLREIDDSTLADYKNVAPASAAGFKCASGKNISVSNEALTVAAKMMAEVDKSYNQESICNVTSSLIQDFPLNKCTKLPQTIIAPTRQTTTGFNCASGKAISVASDALAKAEKMMVEDEDDNILANLRISQMKHSPMKLENKICNGALKSEKETTEADAENRLKRLLCSNSNKSRRSSINDKDTQPVQMCKRVLRSNSIEGKTTVLPTTLMVTPDRMTSLLVNLPAVDSLTPDRIVSTRNRLSLSSKRLKSSGPVSEKNRTPVRPAPLHLQVLTPNLQEFFKSVDTSTPKNLKKLKARQMNLSLSQEVSASTAALLEDEDEAVDKKIQKINWNSRVDMNIINMPKVQPHVTSEVLQARIIKNQEQLEIIKNKDCFRGFIKGGELFTKKLNPQRKKLQELSRHPSLIHFRFLDFSKMSDYKFQASPTEVSKPTEDGAYLVPDKESFLGYEEIKNAFLSLPSVANSLIPSNWIKHHYAMIVHKLHWLESIHPNFLTPENVCLQLKYRYDQEVDRANRSSLRKILECDESPSKRMVLFVHAIHKSDSMTEIELTDRWYTVKASIDTAAQNLIDAGKLAVGTKLMIQSAELLNCEEGCDVLDVPKNVRLRIHKNSMRRARWDIKLGLYRIPKPFLISLDQVDMHGGLVTKLELCILRVYPSMYMRNGNTSGFHSEKMEKRLRNQEDVAKLLNIESIFSQVQKEFEVEEKRTSRKVIASKKNIKDISDPAELFDMIEWEGDASELEAELSSVQRTLLADYQHERYTNRMKEVEKRIQAKLADQTNSEKTRELLKLRVIDFRNPNVTATLSIWSPHPEIKSLLQERTAVEVTNLIPKDYHSYELQLTSSKSSQYKSLQSSKNQKNARNFHSVPEHYFRNVTTIQNIYSPTFKPTFNELDAYGLIVMIGDNESGTRENNPKRFQPVFIADIDQNILCLNFWIGITEYGYEDVIEVNRFVAVNNLQWRSNSASGPIRTAFVMPTTTFTENVKNHHMMHALNAMKEHFRNNYSENSQKFIEKCQEKIKEIKSRPRNLSILSTTSMSFNASSNLNNANNSSMNSSTSTFMHRSTSVNDFSMNARKISVQERLDQLKIYGNPPELSPIPIKRTRAARNAFKVPTRIAEG